MHNYIAPCILIVFVSDNVNQTGGNELDDDQNFLPDSFQRLMIKHYSVFISLIL